jgi:hypothetical protein
MGFEINADKHSNGTMLFRSIKAFRQARNIAPTVPGMEPAKSHTVRLAMLHLLINQDIFCKRFFPQMVAYDSLCDLLEPWTDEPSLGFLCYDVMRVVNSLQHV